MQEEPLERREEREAVRAHAHVVGHHHHVFEESVDRAPQGGEPRQGFRITSRRDEPFNVLPERFDLGRKLALVCVGEEARIDARARLFARLLEDVRDALVGGGEPRRIGERQELGECAQAIVEVVGAMRGRVSSTASNISVVTPPPRSRYQARRRSIMYS